MTQIDPYRLIGHDPAKEGMPTPELLKRARRKVLARFELESAVEVTINGIRVNKNDALKAIEELEDPEKAQEWARYYTNASLKRLRDKPTLMLLVGLVRKGKLDYAEIPPALANQIAEKADQAIRGFFKAGLYTGVSKALEIVGRISDSHKERSARGLRMLLGDLEARIAKARELDKDSKEFRRECADLAQKLKAKRFARMLNQLPGSMDRQREALIREWIMLLIRMTEVSRTRSAAKDVLPMLTELELSPENDRLSRQLIFKLLQGEPAKRRMRTPIGVIFFFAVVTFTVVRTCVNNYTHGPEKREYAAVPDEHPGSDEQKVQATFNALPGPDSEPMGFLSDHYTGSACYDLDLEASYRFGGDNRYISINNALKDYDCVLFIIGHENAEAPGTLVDAVYLENGAFDEMLFSPDSLIQIWLYAGKDWLEGDRTGFRDGKIKLKIPDLLKLHGDNTNVINILSTHQGPRLYYQNIEVVKVDSLPETK